MKLNIIKNAGIVGACDYNIGLEIDRVAETVKATLFVREPESGDPLIAPQQIRAYVQKGSVLFSAQELRAGRDWSDRQLYLAGINWTTGKFRLPVPLNTFTLSTRFSGLDVSRHAFNASFLVGFNVPFADSSFDDCFITVNLGPQACKCLVDGLSSKDIEETTFSDFQGVRKKLFPSVQVTANAPTFKAGEPVSFSLQMVDGLGSPITHDADLYLETVNGFLPVTRRTSQDGKAVATVLTTGMQAGDVVRLKAGFKFYPAAADAEVRLT
jgi:hypothetical protein